MFELEDLNETLELQSSQLDHRFQLALYKEKKLSELDSARGIISIYCQCYSMITILLLSFSKIGQWSFQQSIDARIEATKDIERETRGFRWSLQTRDARVQSYWICAKWVTLFEQLRSTFSCYFMVSELTNVSRGQSLDEVELDVADSADLDEFLKNWLSIIGRYLDDSMLQVTWVRQTVCLEATCIL